MQSFEPGRSLPSRTLDFWFDYTCPYAYLGSTRADALATRMGAKLTWKPLLLGGVFRANNTPQKLFDTLSPAKAAHNLADMHRWAKRFGVTLRMPPNHPMRSVEALRATLACGVDPHVIAAFYRAYWVDNTDIGNRDVIAGVLSSCGHDAARVLERASTPEMKDDLRKRTDEAIGLGIFGVPTWVVDGQHMYWGQDRIAFVEGLTPTPHASASRAAPSTTIDFYWDFSSPFAYLGATQIASFAKRTGTRVTWRPLLLGGLFRSLGMPEVPLATFSSAKQEYVMKDLHRWAAYWGVPFRFPSRFPTNSLRALRIYLALPDDRQEAYRDAVFRACWSEDKDITDDAVLTSCIGDSTIAKDALAKAEHPDVKTALRTATERAHAAGVFGVPTFVVNGELFWGQDRLDLVFDALGA